MLERTMPLVTFRDVSTGEQVTVRLEKFLRREGKPDIYRPWPKGSNGEKLSPIQIRYDAI